MKSVDDIKIDALKSNEYYNEILNEAKEIIKQKVLSMNTKDEQLKYVSEEKVRYMLLKDSNKNYSLVALIIGIVSLISIILLSVLKDNIIFFVLWLLGIVILIGAVAAFAVVNLNGNSIKYTISLMAYEDIEEKLRKGTINKSNDEEAKLKQMMESIRESVEVMQEQLKMIYVLQKEEKTKKR